MIHGELDGDIQQLTFCRNFVRSCLSRVSFVKHRFQRFDPIFEMETKFKDFMWLSTNNTHCCRWIKKYTTTTTKCDLQFHATRLRFKSRTSCFVISSIATTPKSLPYSIGYRPVNIFSLLHTKTRRANIVLQLTFFKTIEILPVRTTFQDNTYKNCTLMVQQTFFTMSAKMYCWLARLSIATNKAIP